MKFTIPRPTVSQVVEIDARDVVFDQDAKDAYDTLAEILEQRALEVRDWIGLQNLFARMKADSNAAINPFSTYVWMQKGNQLIAAEELFDPFIYRKVDFLKLAKSLGFKEP